MRIFCHYQNAADQQVRKQDYRILLPKQLLALLLLRMDLLHTHCPLEIPRIFVPKPPSVIPKYMGPCPLEMWNLRWTLTDPPLCLSSLLWR